MQQRQNAIDIFLAGVDSVKPDNLINTFVSLKANALQIEKLQFDLSTIKNIYVVGAGKASALMAQSIEHILGNKITEGHIITKHHHAIPLRYIELTEAGHPVPDQNGIHGTSKILSIAQKANHDDLFICLISGGGSALLTDVPEGCSLDDLKTVNEILLKSGANISQMNCIRKHLSKVKGGQLAKTAAPATVVSIILSDVIGDYPDVIASGPTVADPSTYDDALNIIKAYQIDKKIPKNILQYLMDGSNKKHPETLKENDVALCNTHNLIIGSNKRALTIAKQKAESLGYECQIITDQLEGDANDAAKYILGIARSMQEVKENEKICLLFGGETTVNVKGNGLGGRNQHLALIAASQLKNSNGITLLSAGTDGGDGPTDAAGAVVDNYTSDTANKKNLSIEEYIDACDAYHFFEKVDGHIITGPTQTNVMDLIVVLID